MFFTAKPHWTLAQFSSILTCLSHFAWFIITSLIKVITNCILPNLVLSLSLLFLMCQLSRSTTKCLFFPDTHSSLTCEIPFFNFNFYFLVSGIKVKTWSLSGRYLILLSYILVLRCHILTIFLIQNGSFIETDLLKKYLQIYIYSQEVILC